MKSLAVNFFLAATSVVAVIQYNSVAQAEEVCRACPFDCQGIGGRDKDCGDRPRRHGQCCVDLDKRGMDQLQDKDEENSQGRHNGRDHDYNGRDHAYNGRDRDRGAYDDRNGYSPGDCPAGFHVNDRKCNDEERRRGCNDMHSPSGQTCVGWNQR